MIINEEIQVNRIEVIYIIKVLPNIYSRRAQVVVSSKAVQKNEEGTLVENA